MSNLLRTRAEIDQRRDAKRERMASWLKDEVYSDYKTAALVLGCTPATAFKALKAMQRDGLLDHHEIGRGSVWSISIRGQIEFLRNGETPWSIFEGRVSEITVRHTLAVQRARVAAEKAGGVEWASERAIRRDAAKGGATPWLKVPDGVVTLQGRRVAVEVERTPKTPKRYQAIMAEYLQMRKAGTVEEVHYVCETERLALGLQRVFRGIESVTIRGTQIALKPEHYEVFRFFTAGQWPAVN